MNLLEVVKMIQEKGGGFRLPNHARDTGEVLTWTVERGGVGLIGGRLRPGGMPVAFAPTGEMLLATDYEWVPPEAC